MKYQYWFANIQGISCKKKLFLLSHVKSAEELYYIEETPLEKCLNEPLFIETVLSCRTSFSFLFLWCNFFY